MNESEILATFFKLSPLEWSVLVGVMLLAMIAHAFKKLDEARTREERFSVSGHFAEHKFAVASSLIVQLGGLYYLVESNTASVFTAFLLGISAESAGGWLRAKSTFK